nr:MAG TPA: hypothetical protein [Caudoviricetes sp.]
MLKRVSRSFFMLFMPREKNMAFYEERSKKANFLRYASSLTFGKIT